MLVSKLFSTSALLLGLSATNVLANMKCDGPDPRQGKEVLICADGNFLTWSAKDCANACSCKNGEIDCKIPSDCATEDHININDYCASGMKDDWVCDCKNQKKDTAPEAGPRSFPHSSSAATASLSMLAGAPGPVSMGGPTTLSTSVVPQGSPGQSPSESPPAGLLDTRRACDWTGSTCDPKQPEKCCSCQCIYAWQIGYICGGGVICKPEDKLEADIALPSISSHPHHHTSSALPPDGPGPISAHRPTSSHHHVNSTHTHKHDTGTHTGTPSANSRHHHTTMSANSHINTSHTHEHTTASHTGTPSAIPRYQPTTESTLPAPLTGLPPYDPSAPTPLGGKNATTAEPHHSFPTGHHTSPPESAPMSINPATALEKRQCNEYADGCSACSECCVFHLNTAGCNQPWVTEIVSRADTKCQPVPIGIGMYSFTMTECTGFFEYCYLYEDGNCQNMNTVKTVYNKAGQCIDYRPSYIGSIKCFGGGPEKIEA